QLCALLPKERWTRASDCLILHGRRVCRPKPLCPTCNVQEFCVYFQTGATSDDRLSERPVRAKKAATSAATPGGKKPAGAVAGAKTTKTGARSKPRHAAASRAKRPSPKGKRRS
ncbi:MAG: hypothetical protein ABMA15_19570, partial [Vicinamibacterales bacterium]